MTKAQIDALKWIRERGGECALARTSAGGRIFLAQGEKGPFTTATVRKLVDAGLAEYLTTPCGKLRRLRLK